MEDLYPVRLQRSIPYMECGVEINTGSVTAHCQCMHGMEPAIDWSRMPVSQTEYQLQMYDVIFPPSAKKCPCPLPGNPGSSRTCNGLRLHFNSQHWGDRIRIMEEHPNPFPKCERCRSQFLAGRLNTCHYALDKCNQGEESCLIRKNLQQCFKKSMA